MQFLMVLIMMVSFIAKGFCCDEMSLSHATPSTVSAGLHGESHEATPAESTPTEHHCEVHCSHLSALPGFDILTLIAPVSSAPESMYSFLYAEPCVALLKRPPVFA
jgi:hypothetical protein